MFKKKTFFLVFLLFFVSVNAIPDTINLQLKVRDATSGDWINGNREVLIKFYDAAVLGNTVFVEDFFGANEIVFTAGLANIVLGSLTDINSSLFNQNLWIGITIGTDSEMDRIALRSVPYALDANYSNYSGHLFDENQSGRFDANVIQDWNSPSSISSGSIANPPWIVSSGDSNVTWSDVNSIFWKQTDLNKWIDQNLQIKASPTFQDLNIKGNANISGRFGFNMPNPDSIVQIAATSPSAHAYGYGFRIDSTKTTDFQQEMAIFGLTQTPAIGQTFSWDATAQKVVTQHNGAGTSSNLFGASYQIGVGGNGLVSTASAMRINSPWEWDAVVGDPRGRFTNLSGILIQADGKNTQDINITNYYGIKIVTPTQPINGGSVRVTGNNYAIYAGSSEQKSYFAGDLNLGNDLNVARDINAGRNIKIDGNITILGDYISDSTTKYKISDLNNYISYFDLNKNFVPYQKAIKDLNMNYNSIKNIAIAEINDSGHTGYLNIITGDGYQSFVKLQATGGSTIFNNDQFTTSKYDLNLTTGSYTNGLLINKMDGGAGTTLLNVSQQGETLFGVYDDKSLLFNGTMTFLFPAYRGMTTRTSMNNSDWGIKHYAIGGSDGALYLQTLQSSDLTPALQIDKNVSNVITTVFRVEAFSGNTHSAGSFISDTNRLCTDSKCFNINDLNNFFGYSDLNNNFVPFVGSTQNLNFNSKTIFNVDDLNTIRLDIKGGGAGIDLIIGGDSATIGSRTDATNKLGRYGLVHYTNSEQQVALLWASSTSTDNNVFFGGGTGVMNAATELRFYTAANNTTTTGTLRGFVPKSGDLNWLYNLKVTGNIRTDSNKLCTDSVCFNINDLNLYSAGTGSSDANRGGALDANVIKVATGVTLNYWVDQNLQKKSNPIFLDLNVERNIDTNIILNRNQTMRINDTNKMIVFTNSATKTGGGTGTLVVTINKDLVSSDLLVNGVITGYLYGSVASFSTRFGGYWYSNTFTAGSQDTSGITPFNSIRFGYNDKNQPSIFLGDINTAWSSDAIFVIESLQLDYGGLGEYNQEKDGNIFQQIRITTDETGFRGIQTVPAGIKASNADITYYNRFFTTTSSQGILTNATNYYVTGTGTIAIKFPTTSLGTKMFTLQGFNYNFAQQWNMDIGVYTAAGNSWLSPIVNVSGKTPFSKIRYASVSDGNYAILLGETTTPWGEQTIVLKTAYTAGVANSATATYYTIQRVTDETAYTIAATNNNVGMGFNEIYFNDNNKAKFGTGNDASIYYDGTNMIINPKEVGVGQLRILSDLNVTGIGAFDSVWLGTINGNKKLDINGTTNIIQFGITASPTQTADLFQILASDRTTKYGFVSGTGDLNWLKDANFSKNVKIDGNTNIKSNLTVDGNLVVLNNIRVDGNVSIKRPYGTFTSMKTQTIASNAVSYYMDFNKTEDSYEILVNADRNEFRTQQTGDYLIELSIIGKSSAAGKRLNIWVRKNGVDIPRSNTPYDFKANNAIAVIAVPFIVDLNSTDYFSVMYSGDPEVTLPALEIQTAPPAPETPSAIMTMTKISEVTH